MQGPRAAARAAMAGATTKAAAKLVSMRLAYRAPDTNDRSWGPATSNDARRWMGQSPSPCKTPPKAALISARVAFTSLGAVERVQHLVGDVVLGVDVNRFLNDQVELFGLGHLAYHPVGAFQNRLQLFVFAHVQVFLELAALALEVAVQVNHLALAGGALRFGQGGCVFFKLLGGGFQLRGQGLDLTLPAGKLLLQLALGRLGRIGLAENAVGVHKTEAEILGGRYRGGATQGQHHKGLAAEHTLKRFHQK